MDTDGHAVLDADLAGAVTDRADRKMVRAALEAIKAGHSCQLTNACDSDWLDCENALNLAGLKVEHLLEEWLRAEHAAKHKDGKRKP